MEEKQYNVLNCWWCGEAHKIGVYHDVQCSNKTFNRVRIRKIFYYVSSVIIAIWILAVGTSVFNYLNSAKAHDVLIFGNVFAFIGIYFIGKFHRYEEKLNWFFGWSLFKPKTEKMPYFGNKIFLRINSEAYLFQFIKYSVLALFLILPGINRILSHIPILSDYEILGYFVLLAAVTFYSLSLLPNHILFDKQLEYVFEELEEWHGHFSINSKYDNMDQALRTYFFTSEFVLMKLRYRNPDESWKLFVLNQIRSAAQAQINYVSRNRIGQKGDDYDKLFELIENEIWETKKEKLKNNLLEITKLILSTSTNGINDVTELIQKFERIYQELYVDSDGSSVGFHRFEDRIVKSRELIIPNVSRSVRHLKLDDRTKIFRKIMEAKNSLNYNKAHGTRYYEPLIAICLDINGEELN